MIEMSAGLVKAQKVLNKVVEQLDHEGRRGYITTFANGRENGLVLSLTDREKDFPVFWVFEARNSDQIVVAKGTAKNKDMDNKYDEQVYRNHMNYFDYNRSGAAAEFIINAIS